MDTSDQASLWLRRSVDGASIVSASEALAIPDWCAQRCELIKDLTGISDSSDADLPLPLSMPELKAWLACAQQVTTVGDTGEPSLKQDDNTLTEAVKAADFLQDSATAAALSQALLLAMLEHDFLHYFAPSDAEIERARRIAHALPPQCLATVFATIARKGDEAPFFSEPSCHLQPECMRFQRLLQMLPPSLYPIVLRACCSINKDGTSISIPPMGACLGTCAAHKAREAAEDVDADAMVEAIAEDITLNTCGPDCTSMLFQLLTLLAPAAPRSPDLGLDTGGATQLPAHDENANIRQHTNSDSCSSHSSYQPTRGFQEEPSPKRVCVSRHAPAAMRDRRPAPSAASELPQGGGPSVTQLVLCLEGVGCPSFWGGPVHESPRWCSALAQLRTLRELRVSAFEPARLSPRQFGAALQSLPALEKLSIECECCSDDAEVCARRAALRHLLCAVAALSQLTALSLTYCIYLGTLVSLDEDALSEDEQTVPLPEVSQLSRLTRLTSLAVKAPVVGPEGSDLFVHAVKQMTALRRLCVEMDACKSRKHDEAAQVMLQLCAATELVALTRLELPSDYGGGGMGYRWVGRLHRWLCRRNPTLLGRLAMLNLHCAFDGGRKKHVTAVRGLLADLPALQSLTLSHNHLDDAGLVRVAPFMTRLTKLDMHGNRATHTGITAVLEATVRGAAAGGGGLRELDISSNSIPEQHVADFAAVLQQLRSLEMLNVRYLFDGLEGLRGAVPALQALPRLRRMRVYMGWDHKRRWYGDEATVAPLLTGLHRVHVD